MRTEPEQRFSFECTRLSYPIMGLCLGVGGAFLTYTTLHPLDVLGWMGILVSLLLTLNFYIIRISIDRETLLVTYGIGFIAQEFDIHEIHDIEMVGNFSLHSVYNPSAEQVPRLHLRDGRSIVLPIDDTRRLMEILKRHRA